VCALAVSASLWAVGDLARVACCCRRCRRPAPLVPGLQAMLEQHQYRQLCALLEADGALEAL